VPDQTLVDSLGRVEWVRRWTYELVWADRYTGVRSREVETVAQLRAVVHWAQANPRIRRWSIQAADRLIGELPERCSQGHRLATYPHRPPVWLDCSADPGHHLLTCPVAGCPRPRVIEPVPGPDCGPPPGWPRPR
jgi:hypothetical protein